MYYKPRQKSTRTRELVYAKTCKVLYFYCLTKSIKTECVQASDHQLRRRPVYV